MYDLCQVVAGGVSPFSSKVIVQIEQGNIEQPLSRSRDKRISESTGSVRIVAQSPGIQVQNDTHLDQERIILERLNRFAVGKNPSVQRNGWIQIGTGAEI